MANPKWYDPVGVGRESMYCPVCQGALGYRQHSEWFEGHCEECRTRFTWWPHETKPLAVLDSDIRHRTCGCGCGR